MSKISKEQLLADFKSAHGTRYLYTDVDYVNSHTKVKILCKKHGAFYQTPCNHKNGLGCPKCGHERTADSKRKDTARFIKAAQAVHGNIYEYACTKYAGNHKPIKIACPQHGVFEQLASAHLRGKGCFKCGVDARSDARRLARSEFIHRARAAHGRKYSYTRSNYTGMLEKLIVTCRIHGDFKQVASAHVLGSGCPKCAKYGFDPSKPATLYVLRTAEFIGYGISNNIRQRLAQHAAALRGLPILDTYLFDFQTGMAAARMERKIKARRTAHVSTEVKGFRTEALHLKYLTSLLSYIEARHGN
jgi:Zn finger protein HypA/HybF involved in hydrogenase expression